MVQLALNNSVLQFIICYENTLFSCHLGNQNINENVKTGNKKQCKQFKVN